MYGLFFGDEELVGAKVVCIEDVDNVGGFYSGVITMTEETLTGKEWCCLIKQLHDFLCGAVGES